jgi:hypothetical protein
MPLQVIPAAEEPRMVEPELLVMRPPAPLHALSPHQTGRKKALHYVLAARGVEERERHNALAEWRHDGWQELRRYTPRETCRIVKAASEPSSASA